MNIGPLLPVIPPFNPQQDQRQADARAENSQQEKNKRSIATVIRYQSELGQDSQQRSAKSREKHLAQMAKITDTRFRRILSTDELPPRQRKALNAYMDNEQIPANQYKKSVLEGIDIYV